MKKKLMDCDVVAFNYSKGKETWKPKARSYMKNNELADILTQYNAEIGGFDGQQQFLHELFCFYRGIQHV